MTNILSFLCALMFATSTNNISCADLNFTSSPGCNITTYCNLVSYCWGGVKSNTSEFNELYELSFGDDTFEINTSEINTSEFNILDFVESYYNRSSFAKSCVNDTLVDDDNTSVLTTLHKVLRVDAALPDSKASEFIKKIDILVDTGIDDTLDHGMYDNSVFKSESVDVLPVVVLHGIASSQIDTDNFSEWISHTFNKKVFNLEIGTGSITSIFTPIMFQLNVLCALIYDIPELYNGFDFIGVSQGGLLARAYVEMCNKYPVRNLITLVTPHGGITIESLPKLNFYSEFYQNTLSFAGYWRNPDNLHQYLEKSTFLPILNNEVVTNESKRYASNMKTLNNFVLVWSYTDETLYPRESAKFSFLDEDKNIVGIEDTELYKNDYLGLRGLSEKGSFHIHNVSCAHDDVKRPSCNNEIYGILKKYL